MCSMETERSSIWMACSTGMTCMPMPAPPGGTIGVAFARAPLEACSKNFATAGCSSIWDWRMLRNSAEPGTSMGRTHCLVRVGFSQLYSSRPM